MTSKAIQPVVFMQDALQKPSHDMDHGEKPSFSDYVASRQPVERPEPTEEQLAFRRYRNGETAAAPVEHPSLQEFADDVPDFD